MVLGLRKRNTFILGSYKVCVYVYTHKYISQFWILLKKFYLFLFFLDLLHFFLAGFSICYFY